MIPKIDSGSLSLGVILSAIVTLAGFIIKRSTSIDISKTSDRAQFTKDAMDEVRNLRIDMKNVQSELERFRTREMTWIRLFATIGAEMRVLNGTLCIHLIEINSEVLDSGALRKQTETMIASLERVTTMLEAEEKILSTSQTVATVGQSPPSTAPKELAK